MKTATAPVTIEFRDRSSEYREVYTLRCRPAVALAGFQKFIESARKSSIYDTADLVAKVEPDSFVLEATFGDQQVAEIRFALALYSLGWETSHGVLVGRMEP